VITSFLLNSSPSSASISPDARAKEVKDIFTALKKEGLGPVDLSDDEFAKSHVRHMVGGRQFVPHERIFRFGKCSSRGLESVFVGEKTQSSFCSRFSL
jgi:threonine dehydratase